MIRPGARAEVPDGARMHSLLIPPRVRRVLSSRGRLCGLTVLLHLKLLRYQAGLEDRERFVSDRWPLYADSLCGLISVFLDDEGFSPHSPCEAPSHLRRRPAGCSRRKEAQQFTRRLLPIGKRPPFQCLPWFEYLLHWRTALTPLKI